MSSVHGDQVSARDLVSHVKRRVQRRNQLQAQLLIVPASPKRDHLHAQLQDVLTDLDIIRTLVREE